MAEPSQTFAESLLSTLIEERSTIATALGELKADVPAIRSDVIEMKTSLAIISNQQTNHEHRIQVLEKARDSHHLNVQFYLNLMVYAAVPVLTLASVLHWFP